VLGWWVFPFTFGGISEHGFRSPDALSLTSQCFYSLDLTYLLPPPLTPGEGTSPLSVIFLGCPQSWRRDTIFSRTPCSVGADRKGGEDKINLGVEDGMEIYEGREVTPIHHFLGCP